MVMDDMNAHLGMLGEPVNWNGEMLVEFIVEMNLENLNETLPEGRDLECKKSGVCDRLCVSEWEDA